MNTINRLASPPCEKKNIVQDDSGYRIQLDEISFNEIDLKWGSYTNPNEKVLTFYPGKPAIVSHFRVSDAEGHCDGKYQSIAEKQFVVYRESPGSYELGIAPTKNKARSFFELAISDRFFNNMLTEESGFMVQLHNAAPVNTPSFDFTAPMMPAMYSIIHDMRNAPYAGYLKGVYLEAKATELFLLQVEQLDRQKHTKQLKLQPKDVEGLYAIKQYLELHYDSPSSISQLSKKAGINQMKLKNGFKELFGTTVFGYLSDIRMEKAKQLLLDEKLFVGEVSHMIGYKHPHHFAAAFKKKFGISPGKLKD